MSFRIFLIEIRCCSETEVAYIVKQYSNQVYVKLSKMIRIEYSQARTRMKRD